MAKEKRLSERYGVEKAGVGDIARLSELVNEFAGRGDMLPRAPAELFETLRDFFVVRHQGEVVGCAALHINWEDLAEVRSLAVREGNQGRGVGSLLVRACVDEARSLGLKRVFALTMKPAFFQTLGFAQADAMTLSRKVWSECYRCPKFMNCDETAMVLDV